MSRFIETLAVTNGNIRNVDLHQKRWKKTHQLFFSSPVILHLEEVIQNEVFEKDVLYKCSIYYDEHQVSINNHPYTPKIHHRFDCIELASFVYPFKFFDRTLFAQLLDTVQDECIFTRNGCITDTSYSNLVFLHKEGYWVTPKTYLLNGTQRQRLLQDNIVQEASISVSQLSEYTHFKLINALLDFSSSPLYDIRCVHYHQSGLCTS